MRSESILTIQEYARLFQQGDERAIAYFFGEFHPALSLYAFRWVENRSIAEEIASAAFVKTWKMHWKLDSYRAIRAYLYKTVRRDCMRTVKQERRRIEIQQSALFLTSPADTPFDNLVRSEVYRTIHNALKGLSPGNRKVLIMHFFEGKSTGEIAAELNLSTNTIKTQKNRALKALRKKLLRPLLLLLFFFMQDFFSPL